MNLLNRESDSYIRRGLTATHGRGCRSRPPISCKDSELSHRLPEFNRCPR
jgi:hypothetical protein